VQVVGEENRWLAMGLAVSHRVHFAVHNVHRNDAEEVALTVGHVIPNRLKHLQRPIRTPLEASDVISHLVARKRDLSILRILGR
jgi:hypothetical protein